MRIRTASTESVVVRRSRGLSGLVPGGVDLPRLRCCHGCCQIQDCLRGALSAGSGIVGPVHDESQPDESPPPPGRDVYEDGQWKDNVGGEVAT